MKNTYTIKQDVNGNECLEMVTAEGVVTYVPMVAGNADYEEYLDPKQDEAKTL
jgi:hypothetical protein